MNIKTRWAFLFAGLMLLCVGVGVAAGYSISQRVNQLRYDAKSDSAVFACGNTVDELTAKINRQGARIDADTSVISDLFGERDDARDEVDPIEGAAAMDSAVYEVGRADRAGAIMPAHQRFTNEQIITAYKDTGSVWKAAKILGAGGQSVWERLKRLGYTLPGEKWTAEEALELEMLAPQCTVGEVARRLGRTYASVACKISELKIGVRFGNNGARKMKRGSGFTKVSMIGFWKELDNWEGTLRPFCNQRGIDLEGFVQASQIYVPDRWEAYVRSHSSLIERRCPQCTRNFVPMTKKQETCSRRCTNLRRKDLAYFGGKRSSTIGLNEGICQLCEKEKKKGLSSHHVFGKENDPENDFLIALCMGCHSLVGQLAIRTDSGNPDFWENLISLAIMRKFGSRQPRPLGFHITVDIDEITVDDCDSNGERAEVEVREVL